MAEEKRNLTIYRPILSSLGWSDEYIRKLAKEVHLLLGERASEVFKSPIRDTGSLLRMALLSKARSKFSNVAGFSAFIRDLGLNPTGGNWSTLEFALFVSETPGLTVAEFEPATVGGRKADVKIECESTSVIAEVKDLNPINEHHQRRLEIIEMLKGFVPDHVQVTVRFRNDIPNEEWNSLGKTLAERVAKVSGPGIIINNANLNVDVIPNQGAPSKDIVAVLEGFEEDDSTGDRFPMTVKVGPGVRLSVGGPAIDVASTIKSCFDRARKQAPNRAPFLLVVDSSSLPAGKGPQTAAIHKEFQPTMNTRISGVLLFNPSNKLTELIATGQLVRNPFAKDALPASLDKGVNCERTLVSATDGR